MVTNYRTAVAAIQGQKDFSNSNGTFSGRTVVHGNAEYGQLGREYWDRFSNAVAAGTYVVFSYRTPIAWTEGDTWVAPSTKYSVTTAKQQGIVRRSVSVEEI